MIEVKNLVRTFKSGDRTIKPVNDVSFELEQGKTPGSQSGLQGTEMWLAIIWLLSDYLGLSDALGYRPRGVHRPEPLVGPR